MNNDLNQDLRSDNNRNVQALNLPLNAQKLLSEYMRYNTNIEYVTLGSYTDYFVPSIRECLGGDNRTFIVIFSIDHGTPISVAEVKDSGLVMIAACDSMLSLANYIRKELIPVAVPFQSVIDRSTKFCLYKSGQVVENKSQEFGSSVGNNLLDGVVSFRAMQQVPSLAIKAVLSFAASFDNVTLIDLFEGYKIGRQVFSFALRRDCSRTTHLIFPTMFVYAEGTAYYAFKSQNRIAIVRAEALQDADDLWYKIPYQVISRGNEYSYAVFNHA